MPLREFACRRCGHRYEDLVRGEERSHCPSCESGDVERLLSSFAVGSPSAAPGRVTGPGACGSCGDPRGPGSCSLD